MAKNMEISSANLKAINPKELTEDIQKLEFVQKELGQADIYPIVLIFGVMVGYQAQSQWPFIFDQQ